MPPLAERSTVPVAVVPTLPDEARRLLRAGVRAGVRAGARAGAGLPRAPLVVTVVVGLTALVAQPALRSTAGPIADGVVRLALPPRYVVLAPVLDVLDAMTLLSVRQHLALLACIAVMFAGWRLLRRGAAPAPPSACAAVECAAVGCAPGRAVGCAALVRRTAS